MEEERNRKTKGKGKRRGREKEDEGGGEEEEEEDSSLRQDSPIHLFPPNHADSLHCSGRHIKPRAHGYEGLH